MFDFFFFGYFSTFHQRGFSEQGKFTSSLRKDTTSTDLSLPSRFENEKYSMNENCIFFFFQLFRFFFSAFLASSFDFFFLFLYCEMSNDRSIDITMFHKICYFGSSLCWYGSSDNQKIFEVSSIKSNCWARFIQSKGMRKSRDSRRGRKWRVAMSLIVWQQEVNDLSINKS